MVRRCVNMTRLRWKVVCFVVLSLTPSVIFLYGKNTFASKDQRSELRTVVDVKRITLPFVPPRDVNQSYVYKRPASLQTLHLSNVSFCTEPRSIPPHLADRRLRLRNVCTSLRKQSPLLWRRRPTNSLLTTLRWDILHHILYCPVPQVGLPWARFMLGSVGVSSRSVTQDNMSDLLRRFPSPSREALEVFALGDGVRVMVARHPLTRLASAYQMLIEEANSTRASESPPRPEGGSHTHSQAKVTVPATFPEFCRYVSRAIEQWVASPHLPPPDPRWMPVTYLCSPCSLNYTILSNVECFDLDVKFISDTCGLRGKARHQLDTERDSRRQQEHTGEASDSAGEDDRPRCGDKESNHVSLLTSINETKKEGRKSYSFPSRTNTRDSSSSVRALLSQLSQEEMDQLHRVYKYDFDIFQYRPL